MIPEGFGWYTTNRYVVMKLYKRWKHWFPHLTAKYLKPGRQNHHPLSFYHYWVSVYLLHQGASFLSLQSICMYIVGKPVRVASNLLFINVYFIYQWCLKEHFKARYQFMFANFSNQLWDMNPHYHTFSQIYCWWHHVWLVQSSTYPALWFLVAFL